MIPWVVAGGLFCFSAAVVTLCAAQRSEIRFLRARLQERHEHVHRVERAAVGLPELAPEPSKPDHPPAHIQIRIDQAIEKWGSGVTQEGKRSDIAAWRRENRSWEWIIQELEAELDA